MCEISSSLDFNTLEASDASTFFKRAKLTWHALTRSYQPADYSRDGVSVLWYAIVPMNAIFE